jgi:phenylpropionate dioxygenase-like ring-hydroxylating dioxygenase large terminal subunit
VPANISIDARAYPAGNEDLSAAMRWFSINSITPVDERTSRYYWTITRCFAQDDTELTELLYKSIHATFMEDVAVLEAQQIRIEKDRPGRHEVALRPDAGYIAARRIIERLLRDEAST